MTVRGPLGQFLAQRTRLIADAAPGTRAARALSDLTDEAVLELSREASSCIRSPFAIFALGGYGARRLLPHSDIDLLIVSRGKHSDLELLVRNMLYPLWDAGLTIGHQMRTPAEQVRAVREDLTTATAFLTARHVAGDVTLAERVLADVFRSLKRDSARMTARITARDRPGSPYLLEPDLKSGAGGQRDIDEMVWRASLIAGRPGQALRPLTDHGLLTRGATDAVNVAQDAINEARWRLNATGSRARNSLSIADSDDLGIDADSLQCALETVHHTLLALRDLASGRPGGASTPLSIADLVRAATVGEAAIEDLERAAYAGRFEHAVPGFRELMPLRRPALAHRYTVGAHSLRTLAALLHESPDRGYSGHPVDLLEPLVVAAVVHDIGKRDPTPDHATR
ncbi:MAG: hypothetical protein JXA36_05445, partial [Coriobacteriia bacterium]|nr:hypothetical protein [Coriobacteriia bacterium]